MVKIGVLALQGAFSEHKRILLSVASDIEGAEVRVASQLQEIDGLIIPGGESTTIVSLAASGGMIEPLKKFSRQNPTWGTCAGLICLADELTSSSQKQSGQIVIGGLHCVVDRNHFGRQLQSFEEQLDVQEDALRNDQPANGVFIRAPCVVRANTDVKVLATLNRERQALIVAVQQGHLLATAFHPELTGDTRWHKYFVSIVRSHVK